MDWYLLNTWKGREEELVKVIHKTVPFDLYQECFVIYQERIWRKQQKSIIHVEPLFPGCVFLTCEKNDVKKEGYSIYQSLAQILNVEGRKICGDFTILPLMDEDAEFLKKISGKDHIVRLSYVIKNEQGQVCKITDPLKTFQGQIERYQFKKRYAMVRHKLWGEERAIVMGIVLKEDRDQKNQSDLRESIFK